MDNRLLEKKTNQQDNQNIATTAHVHTHLSEKSVSDLDKRPNKQLKAEEKTSPSAAEHSPFTIDDYLKALNTFKNYGYEPFIFEFNDELQKLAGVTVAKDVNSYKPSNVVPVDDVYEGRAGMLFGLGPTGLRFFLNTKDNVFYKASLGVIYNAGQNPEVEPKLVPLNPGGYVFASVVLKDSKGAYYLDMRFTKFIFTRKSQSDASGHRLLVDQNPVQKHAYFPVLPVKDHPLNNVNSLENPDTPYLMNMSRTALALCVAGEVFLQPNTGTPNEIKDQDAYQIFKAGTAQTGNFNKVQLYHGTNQEDLIRFLFSKQNNFVFFSFPENELSSFKKDSPAYKARLHELKLQALDQSGFTYEDPEKPTDSSTSTTPASIETKPTLENKNNNPVCESKSLPSSHLFNHQTTPTPPSRDDLQPKQKNSISNIK